MKFGISLPNNQGVPSVRALADLAAEAEGLGYDSVWVSEHLFHASYVAERLGDRPYHEALTVLTAAAMATTRVRLGTSVLVLPWHHPARLAKQVASLDELSGGRVDLGVGVAQVPDEFENLSVPYAGRGALADEIIDAMRCLWEDEVPAFEGNHYAFGGLRFEPKPVQRPLPVLVGGNSSRALRRARERGQGWHGLARSVAETRAIVAALPGLRCSLRLPLTITEAPSERPPEERRTLKGTQAELTAMLRGYADAGLEEIVVDANDLDFERTRALYRRFLSEVVADSGAA